jgi:hypothetical protein
MFYISTIITVLIAAVLGGLSSGIGRYDFTSLLMAYFIPVGGFFVSFAGTSGMIVYNKYAKKNFNSTHYIFAAVAGLLTFFGVHYVEYRTIFFDAEGLITYSTKGNEMEPLSNYINFFQYLIERNSSSAISRLSLQGPEMGYILTNIFFYLQAIGSIAGGLFCALWADNDAKSKIARYFNISEEDELKAIAEVQMEEKLLAMARIKKEKNSSQ